MKPAVIFLVAAMLLSALGAQARTAMDFFRMGAADRGVALIDSLTRMDMADYFDGGLNRPSRNRAGGTAIIRSASPRSLVFTQAGDIPTTLDLLIDGRDTVLMVTETMKLPQEDSRISFYTTNWAPLPRSPLAIPSLEDWLTPEGKQNMDTVMDALPFILARAAYDQDNATLTFTHTMGQYFKASPETLEILRKYLRPSVTYAYRGKKFKRQ